VVITAWITRPRRSALGLARLAPKSGITCPLLAVEDPAVQRTRFWKAAMLDPVDCPVRGLDIATLPAHVKPFAEFMVAQSKREMTPRDIVKAYLLTVSSVQRGAISTAKVKESWPDAPFRSARVRPEDVMGAILRTPAGRRYLDAATRGEFDTRDARIIKRWFMPFGLAPTFEKQLRAAPKLAREAKDIDRRLHRDSTAAWANYLEKHVPYIGPAKAGFFSALMGRGDLPTADAKELDFWFCRLGEWDRARMKCRASAKVTTDPPPDKLLREVRGQLADRLASMRVKMPRKYKPFYQHLVHHAVWDTIGKTATTHQEMIDAMRSA
jgi:hypothetical protein